MRVQLAAIAVGVIAAGLLTGGGNASAPADAQRRPTCFGARATIVGTAKADVLRGTKRRDVIVARGGRDRVYGRGGGDLLCGGPGDDLLDGGAGYNRLDGGPGRDQCLRVARSIACELPRRQPAPAVSGPTIDGKEISLAGFRGRAVFVNVWASW